MTAPARFEHIVQSLVADHGGETSGDPADTVNWTWGEVDLAAADCGDDTHFVLAAYFGLPAEIVSQGALTKLLLEHAHSCLGDADAITYALDPETGEIVGRQVLTYERAVTSAELVGLARDMLAETRSRLAEMLALAYIAASGEGGEAAADGILSPLALA